MESRRKFLTACLAAGVPVVLLSTVALGQRPTQGPPPKPAQGDRQQEEDAATPKFDSKTTLEANQKDIKKNIEKLFQLASDLKAEVEKTDAIQVLSLAMLKKTEEIEKLAKEIRSRAIG